jgi:hypothetical protein
MLNEGLEVAAEEPRGKKRLPVKRCRTIAASMLNEGLEVAAEEPRGKK